MNADYTFSNKTCFSGDLGENAVQNYYQDAYLNYVQYFRLIQGFPLIKFDSNGNPT